METLFWILIAIAAPALAMIIVPAGIAFAEIAVLIIGAISLFTIFSGLFKSLNERITKLSNHKEYVKAERKKEEKRIKEIEALTSELDEDQKFIIKYYLK